MVVVMQITFEVCLHLLDRFVTSGSSRHPEMLVQQHMVQTLNETIDLRTKHTSSTMFDAFKL